MKFTEEQAREALRAELTNKGRKSLAMSERTLAKTTESLMKKLADEETGLPDFVESAIEILNTVNDNVRKDKSDFANDWKKEHPETNPQKDPGTPKLDENPEMKALMERIAASENELKTLKEEREKRDKEASVAQKRKDIVAKLKEKGVKDEEWLNDLLSEVNITEDFDVDAKTESYLKLYNKTIANGGNSVPPANPNGGTANNAITQSIRAAAELAKRERANIETKKE